jgi:hypothetical protein
MPEICRFYGIIIAMFYSDHAPPHFHIRYGEYKAIVNIENLTVIRGHLPPRALGMVIEWAVQRQDMLRENWKLASSLSTLKKIKPLE